MSGMCVSVYDCSDLCALRLLLPRAEHVHDLAVLGSDWSADVPLWKQTAQQYCSQEVSVFKYLLY